MVEEVWVGRGRGSGAPAGGGGAAPRSGVAPQEPPAPRLSAPARRLGLPAAGGRGRLPVCAGPQPPGRLSREVGEGAEEAETAEVPARPGSEARGCMERPAWFCGLLALLLCASGSGDAAPTETQPPVTNLSVSVENLCTIIWTWNPPEGASPNCSLRYFSHFGDKQDKKIAPETHRSKEVPLNEKVCLQVGSQCSTSESEKPSILVEKCVSPPEGDPESAVTELQCIWHNLSNMKCSWLPGRNTSPDTNYTLYYWHSSLGKILQCENIYREGQHIGCSFDLTKVKDSTAEQHGIQIMVKDNAGKIRPSFNVVPLASHVKPDPPHIKNLFFQNDNLHVQWENPRNFTSRCLYYEVEVNNSQSETCDIFYVEEAKCQDSEFERNTEDTICFMVPGVLPDTLNTVRIRVKTNKLCYEDDKLWSNWSQAMSIGKEPNSTFYITMLLIIPVIVTGAIIILLLYLKRLKIIIFPPIPDPGKIFKEMFGDQNDDTLHWKKYDIYEKQIKEETDSVVLIENLKKASQ
ncbi:interleukin-13 receptor subunit alpha-1 [Oryctolagus cuniculus]|uniref:interleukin-13 receptor subunit alpha-1 n=1 Tax=Oryctolagus cuniculus TaxID=9986 RepID=UPI002232B32C|nr:interleukin-13 receptor subunit alpha-1 [Oryctolagus cuniculus]